MGRVNGKKPKGTKQLKKWLLNVKNKGTQSDVSWNLGTAGIKGCRWVIG